MNTYTWGFIAYKTEPLKLSQVHLYNLYQSGAFLIHRLLLPASTVWSPVAALRSSIGCPPQGTLSPLDPSATDFYSQCHPQSAPGLQLSNFFVRAAT